MKTQKKCVIYARFSPRPAEAVADCQSIPTQIAACRAYAEREGYTVIEVFCDEQKSRNDIEREGIYAAIDRLFRGWVLVALSPDRVGAGTCAALIERDIEAKGCTIEYATGDLNGDSPETRMMRGFLRVIAEYERAKIGQRTSAGMRYRQSQGERMTHADRLPIGKKADPENPDRMVDDETEKRTISWILRQHKQGAGAARITRMLNEPERTRQMPPRGHRWHLTTVKRILKRHGKDRKAKG